VTLTPVRLSFSPTKISFPWLVGQRLAELIPPFSSSPILSRHPCRMCWLSWKSAILDAALGTFRWRQDAGENRLVLGRQVFENGLVGVRISGPIEVRPVISQGVGDCDRYVVTKAEHNMVQSNWRDIALERLPERV